APLPNIACHINTTVLGLPLWIGAHCCGPAHIHAKVHSFFEVLGVVAPGISFPIGSSSRLLPLGLARQHGSRPFAIAHCVIPCNEDNRVVVHARRELIVDPSIPRISAGGSQSSGLPYKYLVLSVCDRMNRDVVFT